MDLNSGPLFLPLPWVLTPFQIIPRSLNRGPSAVPASQATHPPRPQKAPTKRSQAPQTGYSPLPFLSWHFPDFLENGLPATFWPSKPSSNGLSSANKWVILGSVLCQPWPSFHMTFSPLLVSWFASQQLLVSGAAQKAAQAGR